jgi:hypothetical protein
MLRPAPLQMAKKSLQVLQIACPPACPAANSASCQTLVITPRPRCRIDQRRAAIAQTLHLLVNEIFQISTFFAALLYQLQRPSLWHAPDIQPNRTSPAKDLQSLTVLARKLQ